MHKTAFLLEEFQKNPWEEAQPLQRYGVHTLFPRGSTTHDPLAFWSTRTQINAKNYESWLALGSIYRGLQTNLSQQ